MLPSWRSYQKPLSLYRYFVPRLSLTSNISSPFRFLTVKYEDLCEDPWGMMKYIFTTFLGYSQVPSSTQRSVSQSPSWPSVLLGWLIGEGASKHFNYLLPTYFFRYTFHDTYFYIIVTYVSFLHAIYPLGIFFNDISYTVVTVVLLLFPLQ